MTLHDIPNKGKRRVAPTWSWRSTGDAGMFELWRDGRSVGMLSLLPAQVHRRAVLMDAIVDHLNTHETDQP